MGQRIFKEQHTTNSVRRPIRITYVRNEINGIGLGIDSALRSDFPLEDHNVSGIEPILKINARNRKSKNKNSSGEEQDDAFYVRDANTV